MALDPNRALLGVLLGLLLIYRECLRPGSVVPGVAGGVLLMVSLHSLSRETLPGDVIVHLVMGAALLALQAFRTWAWLPAIAGSLALLIAALHQGFKPVYAATTVPVAGITAFLLRTAVRARWNKTAG